MKLLKEQTKDKWGTNMFTHFTDDFEKEIKLAKEKILPFVKDEVSRWTVYFKVKGEEVGSEYDCCDDPKCIKQTKADIRNDYGKGTHVEECWYDNDGDHDRIDICCQCSKPLNEFLTWANSELEYLESEKEAWDELFFEQEAFLINSILQSMPTNDYQLETSDFHNGEEYYQQALKQREEFFQRVKILVDAINETL